MITNTQYKEDMLALIHTIKRIDKAQAFTWSEDTPLQTLEKRINAIPDKDEEVMLSKWPNEEPKAVIIPPSQFKGSNKVPAREQDKIDREERKRKFREDSEPHDLGNTLHIPGEDD